jgi:hypothetical protein
VSTSSRVAVRAVLSRQPLIVLPTFQSLPVRDQQNEFEQDETLSNDVHGYGRPLAAVNG